jgi:hypothetical protein
MCASGDYTDAPKQQTVNKCFLVSLSADQSLRVDNADTRYTRHAPFLKCLESVCRSNWKADGDFFVSNSIPISIVNVSAYCNPNGRIILSLGIHRRSQSALLQFRCNT